LLGHHALNYIQKHKEELYAKVKERQAIIKEVFGLSVEGLIVPIRVNDNRKVMQIQKILLEEGLLVGAIRQPTVSSAIIRFIARLGMDTDHFREKSLRISQVVRETI